jgi:hypothetical protein
VGADLPNMADIEYKFLIHRANNRIEWEPGPVTLPGH